MNLRVILQSGTGHLSRGLSHRKNGNQHATARVGAQDFFHEPTTVFVKLKTLSKSPEVTALASFQNCRVSASVKVISVGGIALRPPGVRVNWTSRRRILFFLCEILRRQLDSVRLQMMHMRLVTPYLEVQWGAWCWAPSCRMRC